MSWAVIPLKRLAAVFSSAVDKNSIDGQAVVRLCNYTDVYHRDSICPDQVFMTATASSEQIKTYALRKDDVVITKDSESPDDIGIPTFIAESAPDLVCGYHLTILRPNPDAVDGRYLYWCMRSRWVRRQLEARCSGVTRFGLRNEVIANTLVSLPGLEEQRRIAHFLDAEVDRLRLLGLAKQKYLALLTERRQSLYQAAASGQLTATSLVVPRDNLQWIPAIADGWPSVKLTLVAQLGTGHTPSRSNVAYWSTDRDVPWLTTSDIEYFRDDHVDVLTDTKERISRIGLVNSSAVLHAKSTVALSRTASVGFSVVMGKGMATSQDFVTWTCSARLEPRFLLICLRAMRRDLVGRLAIGSTHKTIYMSDIQALRIPLPGVHEQRKIIRLVERGTRRLNEVVDRVSRQVSLFTERSDAVITAAVTGQLSAASHRRPAHAA